MSTPQYGSISGQLNVHDWRHVLKAFIFTLIASAFMFVIGILPKIHPPTEYVAFYTASIPLLTSALTALYHFFQDRSNIIESL